MIINTIMLLLLMFSKFENTSIFIKKSMVGSYFLKLLNLLKNTFN